MEIKRLLPTICVVLAVLAPSPDALGRGSHNSHKSQKKYDNFFWKYHHKKNRQVRELESIRAEMDELNAVLNLISDDVALLADEVDYNGVALESLAAQLEDVTSVPPGLAEELEEVRAQHDADMALMADLIDLINDEVVQVTRETRTLAGELEGSIDSMISGLDSWRTSSKDTYQAITVDAALTSINTNLHALNADLSDLEGKLGGQDALLATIDMRLEALEEEQSSDHVSAIRFETLDSTCTPSRLRDMTFSVNGTEVATSQGDATTSCGCTPPVTSVEADLSAVSLAGDGSDSLSFSSNAMVTHFFSWSRAIVTDINGNEQSYCLYDEAGGDCTETNLCSAGYTYDAVEGSAVF